MTTEISVMYGSEKVKRVNNMTLIQKNINLKEHGWYL